MTDPVPSSNPSTRWLWIAVIAVLAIALVLWLINPAGDPADSEITQADPSVNLEVPADVPDTQTESMSNPGDPTMITTIEDDAVTGAEVTAEPPAEEPAQ